MTFSVCQQALRQTFGAHTNLVDFHILTDGYRNTTASVLCDAFPKPLFFKTEKPFLYPRTQKYQISREAVGLQLCAQHDIPVPRFVAAGTASAPWLLEEFVCGSPLSTFQPSKEELIHLSSEFQTVFHKLCQIGGDGYGDTFEGGVIGKHKEWKNALGAMTRLTFEDCCAVGLFGNSASIVEAALNKALSCITDSSAAVFYHCDLFSANIMTERSQDGQLHITSVIDFGMSLFAPVNYVRGMTYRYCDLFRGTSYEKSTFEDENAYCILRIEPLLMMKLFRYPNADSAIQQHISECVRFLEM